MDFSIWGRYGSDNGYVTRVIVLHCHHYAKFHNGHFKNISFYKHEESMWFYNYMMHHPRRLHAKPTHIKQWVLWSDKRELGCLSPTARPNLDGSIVTGWPFVVTFKSNDWRKYGVIHVTDFWQSPIVNRDITHSILNASCWIYLSRL